MFKILAPHFSRKNNKSREHLIYSLLVFVVSATKLSFPFFSFGWKYSYS